MNHTHNAKCILTVFSLKPSFNLLLADHSSNFSSNHFPNLSSLTQPQFYDLTRHLTQTLNQPLFLHESNSTIAWDLFPPVQAFEYFSYPPCIKAAIEDCRAEVVGGIVTGLEIWELAVIPYLINNCETWACMHQKTLDILDSLQNQFLRSLLATPRGTPTPALMWETGTSTMGNRIMKRKLIFVHHLFNLPETSLANQCAIMQEEMSLPGLISEIKEVLAELDLPNMKSLSKLQWKNLVNKKILKKNKDDLVNMAKNYKKIDSEEMAAEKFERKSYMTDLRMDQARMNFKIKTNIKLNFKNDPKSVKALWKCPECSHLDSQEHVLWCEGYTDLRMSKDLSRDKELTTYYQQVMNMRERK
jgi:hypothetical protein